MKLAISLSAFAVGAGLLLAPAEAAARDDTPSIISYGLDGFWTGAQIGLASGFIATGSDFESHEWRKLAFGTGIGAIVGVGLGLTLGIVDVGSAPPRTGRIILRDVGYGVGLGALVGTAVGALFLIDSGEPKDLLTGAAIGTLVGAGAGVIFGIIEGTATSGEAAVGAETHVARTQPSLRFTFVGSDGSVLPLPALAGTF